MKKTAKLQVRPVQTVPPAEYSRFKQIDGSHPFRNAVPEGYVEYGVCARPGGKLAYFNFDLAKEMGLVGKIHSHALNSELERAVLQTFALQIINEFDLAKKSRLAGKKVLPSTYIATRYLQLQHPNKRGKTSGDGRSIWNGVLKHGGVSWDISSCGTGATCLSPATAIEKRFFKTGSHEVAYGCGYSDFDEGLSAAIMSEIFHRNGVRTERTLAVISFPNGTSINVRAARNLLRPSHFFCHLKQGNHRALKAIIDLFIDRQVANREWNIPRGVSRYDFMAEWIATRFGEIVAKFDSDYIFVWLDWDGDNILADGSIIDYGSVRQFGLYHHEYRYDDVDRFSTKIGEQRIKVRYIVQTFAQIRDFLKKGKKRNIQVFRNDPVLKIFDRSVRYAQSEELLKKTGFDRAQRTLLLESAWKEVERFRRIFTRFERARTKRAAYRTGDGVTRDAIYCMRDVLRELPAFLAAAGRHMTPTEFMEVMSSSYARASDRKVTAYRAHLIQLFQNQYQELMKIVAEVFKVPEKRVLAVLTMRSSVINRFDRITGDSVICATDHIRRNRKKLSRQAVIDIIQDLVHYQILSPDIIRRQTFVQIGEKMERVIQQKSAAAKVMKGIVRVVRDLREGI